MGSTKSRRSVRLTGLLLVVLAMSLGAVSSAHAGRLLLNTNCGTVAANKKCDSGVNSVFTSGTVYARFTLVNGPGVNHCAYVFASGGARCGTSQYVYSKCYALSGTPQVYMTGLNNSATAHKYTLQLYSKTSSNDPC